MIIKFVVSFQRNITGNSPIFLPAITRKAAAKLLLFLESSNIFLTFAQNIHFFPMKKTVSILMVISTLLLIASCTSHYQLTSINRSRIVIDQRFDNAPDTEAAAYIAPYKAKVDSVMGPIIGTSAKYMAANRPESELSNLLSDILIWASKEYNEKPVLGIYNMGGIRTAVPEGKVTYGDILEVAPFENKILFLTLKGDDFLTLLRQIAARGGEGVSHGLKMVISSNKELLSVTLHGKPIDAQKNYRIATIDYLAQGNDGLTAFKKGFDIVSPKEKKNNSRFLIMKYFREKEANGEKVSGEIEGRIVIQK